MTNVGEAWYEIDARTNKLRSKLDDADSRIRQTGDRAERSLSGRLTNAFGTFGGVVGGVAKVAAGAGLLVGGAFGVIGGLAVKGAGDAESMNASWEVLLGSVEKAHARTEELKRFAATTPFEIPEVMAASRTLQIFGGDALATGDNLRLVGDIASGVQQPFSDVAMWIGRTYDAMKSGQPFGEAAMRLQEMGALSGEGRKELERLAAESKSGAITMEEAWSGAEAVFSQFSGGMERQSQTLNGQISNLMDNIGQSLAGVGEILLPVVKDIVEGINGALPSMREFFITTFERAEPILRTVGDVIGDLIRFIGTLFSEEPEQIRQFGDQFAGMGGMVVGAVETIMQIIESAWPILLSAFESAREIAEGVFPVIAAVAQIAFETIQSVIEHVAPVVERALGFIAEEVVPPLQRAFEAIAAWVQENWPMISAVIDAGAAAIGGALSAIISVLEVLWPIIVNVGEVVLPILGTALEILFPILQTFFEIASEVFNGVADVVTWMVEEVFEPVITMVVDILEQMVLPAIEAFGASWGEIWTAVGGFFEALWNGILSFLGEVVGTIIGVIASVAEAAAGIPGPWQEGAKETAAALRGMEADAKTWGDTTSSTLRTSYAQMREDARAYAQGTAAAWGEGFASYSNVLADNVATALGPARNVLYATSPPRSQKNPLHDIERWAAGTADAYADAWRGKAGAIAAAVGFALEPARDMLQPDVSGSFVGSNERLLNATLDVRISGDPSAIAALPGGATGVAAALQRGLDVTGLLRELRHDVAIG